MSWKFTPLTTSELSLGNQNTHHAQAQRSRKLYWWVFLSPSVLVNFVLYHPPFINIYQRLRRYRDIYQIPHYLFIAWTHVLIYFMSLSGVTVVSPRMGTSGWPFANVDDFPGADVDTVNNAQHVRDLYLSVQHDYSGRFVA